jgi:hypothetical protein
MVPSEVTVIQSSIDRRSVRSLDTPSLADSHLLGEAAYNSARHQFVVAHAFYRSSKCPSSVGAS